MPKDSSIDLSLYHSHTYIQKRGTSFSRIEMKKRTGNIENMKIYTYFKETRRSFDKQVPI